MKSKKHNSGCTWFEKSVSTISRSLVLLFFILILSSCKSKESIGTDHKSSESEYSETNSTMYSHLTTNNYVSDIVNHPTFKGFGELMLPRDDNSRYYNTPLTNVASLLPYHNHVEPDIVVDAINYMIDESFF